MSNPYFQFKQFTIYQDRCAMKVGTDGVLLGAWADVSSAHSILDIGTGTGLIALMVAQRSGAFVTALEMDVEASKQALENVERSPWNEKIKVVNLSLQEYDSLMKYDHIISNPPYFNQSLKSPKEGRTTARHTDTLSYDDLLKGVVRLLDEEGIFSVILPFSEKERFVTLAEQYNLYPARITEVLPTPISTPKRFMAEFSFQQVECQQKSLIIESAGRHQYSDDYKQLTEQFYL
ncbi:MAG: methyltransferase [Paludibacteraceae bacterium]|nr:methyltransferase [Paludibacteraceae bacterium]